MISRSHSYSIRAWTKGCDCRIPSNIERCWMCYVQSPLVWFRRKLCPIWSKRQTGKERCIPRTESSCKCPQMLLLSCFTSRFPRSINGYFDGFCVRCNLRRIGWDRDGERETLSWIRKMLKVLKVRRGEGVSSCCLKSFWWKIDLFLPSNSPVSRNFHPSQLVLSKTRLRLRMFAWAVCLSWKEALLMHDKRMHCLWQQRFLAFDLSVKSSMFFVNMSSSQNGDLTRKQRKAEDAFLSDPKDNSTP